MLADQGRQTCERLSATCNPLHKVHRRARGGYNYYNYARDAHAYIIVKLLMYRVRG